MKKITFFLLLFIFTCNASTLDYKLDKVIEIYQLKGFDCKTTQQHDPKLASLGDTLFNSKLLSGGNDTSCSTCHIADKHRVDGLPISIGVGGDGEGIERLKDGNGILVPRNSFTFTGRGHLDYDNYFWDGKVQVQQDKIINILGDMSDKGFHSPFAMASVLPLLARDEFLGLLDYAKTNKMISIDDSYYEARYEHATQILRDKIAYSKGDEWLFLKEQFKKSNINLNNLELSDIGNAISSFLIQTENCINSRWSAYIKDDKKALNQKQKAGAFIFYGKGRCASCHSGDLLTDLKFHSIALPQGQFGFSIDGQDLGRAEISLNHEDRFKFKTPSLLNVKNTAPYGHNGLFPTIKDIVLFHLNPILFLKEYTFSDNEKYNYGRVLSSRSKVLSHIELFNDDEVSKLVAFLETL